MRDKMMNEAATGSGRDAEKGSTHGVLELANPTHYGLPPLLQSHILESQHYKSLVAMDTFEQLLEEINTFTDSIEPYHTNSTTVPSALFCCLYRLFTLGLESWQLKRLINYSRQPYARCIGFLFVRIGLAPESLWPYLGEYVLDDQELRPTKDADAVTSIGEFVEGLLSQDRYYSCVLPRLPMSVKRRLDEKLAQVPQYRKRLQANSKLLDVYRRADVRVEACLEDGTWVSAQTIELDDSAATRLKVRVRLDDGGRQESCHLGKVILADSRFSANNGYYRPGRSRSRSRSPAVDWARHKGKTQAELVDEHRRQDRERAVCASGKEYAKKPVGFKVACALPRGMGVASQRLMEDETFVPKQHNSRRRSPSPSQQESRRSQPSAEHQAQMQQLFEKYGMAKSADAAGGTGRSLDQGEGPDVMRFG